jgi:ParB family chromosome partitioning protein
VLVMDDDTANHDSMRAFAENIVRTGLGTVDMWRAIEALCGDGWTDDGIATALALPPRIIKRLKLCGSIHPAILDQMAKGDEPNERDLRMIASATREEQAEAWKKHKPKKGEHASWWDFARALTKTRFYARDADFDAKTAEANGIVWEEDLFEQGDKDNRFTTQGEAYLNAQHEHLTKKLPKGHVILPINEHGEPKLPAKAVKVYGNKPGKGETAGRFVNERTGAIETIIFRMPEPKKPVVNSKAKPGASGGADPGSETSGSDEADTGEVEVSASTRAAITQEGVKMIGDLQTDALHEALSSVEIDDQTLIALLVVAFAGENVTVRTGEKIEAREVYHRRETIAATLTPGGDLTADPATIRTAARDMLRHALSLRINFGGNSGLGARIAGYTIDARQFLPTMATQDFLSCVSKPEIERIATSSGVLPRPTGKATRAAVIERFKDERYIHPAAAFELSAEDIAKLGEKRKRMVAIEAMVGDEEADDTTAEDAGEDETEADDEAEPLIEAMAAE